MSDKEEKTDRGRRKGGGGRRHHQRRHYYYSDDDDESSSSTDGEYRRGRRRRGTADERLQTVASQRKVVEQVDEDKKITPAVEKSHLEMEPVNRGIDQRLEEATKIQKIVRGFLWRKWLSRDMQRFVAQRRRLAWEIGETLITEIIQREVLPEILLELLTGGAREVVPVSAQRRAEVDIAETIISEVVDGMADWIVRKICTETAREYLKERQSKLADPIMTIFDEEIFEPVISLAIRDTVRAGVEEVAQEYLAEIWLSNLLFGLISPVIEETAQLAIFESEEELAADAILDSIVIEMSEELCREEIGELMTMAMSERQRQESEEMREISKQMCESVMLDALLRIVATRGEALCLRAEFARASEELMLHLMLSYALKLQDQQDAVTSNIAFQFHLDLISSEFLLDAILRRCNDDEIT